VLDARGGRLDDDHPLRLELPGRRAGQVAAVLAEHVPDLADGAVAVVGEGLDQHRDAAGAVALVEDLLEVAAFAAAERPLDGALDVVQGYVVALRGRQRVLQREVDAGVTAAARAHGGLDRADVLADDLAALTVQHRLLALDLGPFAMSCQGRVLQPAARARTAAPGHILPHVAERALRATGAPSQRGAASADDQAGLRDVPDLVGPQLDLDRGRPLGVAASAAVDHRAAGRLGRERGADAVHAARRRCRVDDALLARREEHRAAGYPDVAGELVDDAVGVDRGERHVA